MLFTPFKVLIFDSGDGESLKRCIGSVEQQTTGAVDWTVTEGSTQGLIAATAALRPEPEDIVVFIRSSDWLFNQNVFGQLYEAYLRYDILFTNGFYLHHQSGRVGGSCEPPPKLIASRNYRKTGWRCPGLKSCKGKLLDRIEPHHLDSYAFEPSLTYPMLELAGPHLYFFRNVQVVSGTDGEWSWDRPVPSPKYPRL